MGRYTDPPTHNHTFIHLYIPTDKPSYLFTDTTRSLKNYILLSKKIFLYKDLPICEVITITP